MPRNTHGEHVQDVALRVVPGLLDAVEAWRLTHGQLAAVDMVRLAMGMESLGRHARGGRPGPGRLLNIRAEASVRSAARLRGEVLGMPAREYMLLKLCELLSVPYVAAGKGRPPVRRVNGGNMRGPLGKPLPRCGPLVGDPLSRWPRGQSAPPVTWEESV